MKDAVGLELAIYRNTGSGAELKQHNIFAGSDNAGKLTPENGHQYYIKDHLGSIRVVIDPDRQVLSANDFDAWGYYLDNRGYEMVPENETPDYKFTSKERDRESNYDYFGARYYDSRIGRWGSVDPLFEKQFTKNSYEYCSNNPIILIDPFGLDDIYYKDGKEYKREENSWLHNLFFGDNYFVHNEKGNVNYKGENYFEALSERTVKQFDWNRVDAGWQNSESETGFNTRLNEALKNGSNEFPYNYKYVAEQSFDGGDLDQKRFLNSDELYVYNNIVLNYQEAGNLIWGAALKKMDIEIIVAELGAQSFSILKNKGLDEYNETQAYKIGYHNYNTESNYFKYRAKK